MAYTNQDKLYPVNALSGKNLFWHNVKNTINDDWNEIKSIPFDLKKIVQFLSKLNGTRLQLVFSRIMVASILNTLSEAALLEKLDRILGTHTNIPRLDGAAPIFNALSISIYGIRFSINIILAIKAGLYEQDNDGNFILDTNGHFKRKKQSNILEQIKAIHCDLLNDNVWGVVNGICNYAQFFHISASMSGALIGVFLAFDIGLLTYRKFIDYQKYKSKKLELEQKIEAIKKEIDSLEIASKYGEKSIINKQDEIMRLEKELASEKIKWQTNNATYFFLITAASLLFAGFTASLMLTFFASGPLCLVVCAIAASMYISSNEFNDYAKKSLILEQNPESVEALLTMRAARNTFIFEFVKNIVVPVIIISAVAIYWPAAIVLFVGYILYEYVKKSQIPKEPELQIVNKDTESENNDINSAVLSPHNGNENDNDSSEDIDNVPFLDQWYEPSVSV